MSRAVGAFTVTGGSEQPIHEAEGEVKLTRVSGTQRFDGDIVGEGSVDWIFCYRPDRTASFLGFARIEGSTAGRTGSLFVESTGDHDGRSSRGRWRVVPGSGTGELVGIRGVGSFSAPGGPQVSYELDLDFD